MTEIYLRFECAHHGMYSNAPVAWALVRVAVRMASYRRAIVLAALPRLTHSLRPNPDTTKQTIHNVNTRKTDMHRVRVLPTR